MTEQSQLSNTASPEAGKESSSLTIEQAEERLAALRRAAGVRDDSPQPLAGALPKISPSSPACVRQRIAERREYMEAQAQRERAERCRIMWESAKVPKRHANAVGLRETASGAWRTALTQLSDALSYGFIAPVLGKRGVGKTQLGVCLIREACDMGISSRYVTAMDLFDELREAMKGDASTAFKRRMDKTGLLVIDELHEKPDTDYTARELINLIDHRYSGMSSTVLIANTDIRNFTTIVGDSVVSRINEAGIVIECDWPSYRDDAP